MGEHKLHAFARTGDCCDIPLAEAIAEGVLNTATIWTCPECGIDWRAEQVGPVMHWTPRPVVAIVR